MTFLEVYEENVGLPLLGLVEIQDRIEDEDIVGAGSTLPKSILQLSSNT